MISISISHLCTSMGVSVYLNYEISDFMGGNEPHGLFSPAYFFFNLKR